MLQRRTFSFAAAALAALSSFSTLAADGELRVLVHSSFSLPKPLLAKFEAEAGIKLSLIKAGDAGEMLNKLILTRAQPIADVVFGLDNALVAKAQAAKVLEPIKFAEGSPIAQVGGSVVPVDYGFVTLNFDKASFAKSGLALPKSMDELAQPAYRNLLVVPNPATSSPGYQFLLATIAGMGEEKAFDWWARMRANGVKVVKGWSEAYYTEFSRNGGTRPLVVSYATSPAAEVFYSKEKISESPTANLFLKGGVFRQIEGVALVAGGGQRDAAHLFIRFMRSGAAQEALQTSMWMYPVEAHTPLAEVMKHATEPTAYESLPAETIADKGTAWVARWTQVVLK
ncbi:thiamine transport system substrate-binding protein [Rhodoferax sp. OV413]|uniref:thiamine ABC transporter substrate-binding protein n=1 Tax=Rhodoferax sp. OV413 TaxID=1855285 RepID=UPI0008881FA7|nr:thiamine ABC transporter substrate-binding protein [Rhodoferax sp. OV413]SDP41486.1 thiamine transport system substrate-binding protein [Rhodoferax sp. OV413]